MYYRPGMRRICQGLLALCGALLIVLGVSPARAEEVMSPVGPLARIVTTPTLGCYVQRQNVAVPSWYGTIMPYSRNGPEYPGCGTALWVSGHVYGPEVTVPGGGGQSPVLERSFTPVSAEEVVGEGTAQDPFVLRTISDAGDVGMRVEQKDVYVEGDDSYRTVVTLHNHASVAREVRLSRVGDCTNALPFSLQFLGIFGQVSDAGGIGCFAAAGGGSGAQGQNVGNRFEPATAGSTFLGTSGAHVWQAVAAGVDLPNGCINLTGCFGENSNFPNVQDPSLPSSWDPGIAISWHATVPAGQSRTFELDNGFSGSSWGMGPNPVTVTPSQDNVLLNEQVTYNLETSWTDLSASGGPHLESLTVQLPAGAVYQPGSGTGDLRGAEAVRAGRSITFWPGRLSEPGSPGTFKTSLTGSFSVRYASVGRKALVAGAQGVGAVFASALDAAPVYVRTEGAVAPPGSPVITAPVEGSSLVAGDIGVEWTASERANRYSLVVDGVDEAESSETRATVALQPGQHELQVVAVNESGTARSPVRTVNVTERSGDPLELIEPGPGVTVDDDATFSWTALRGASSYELIIDGRPVASTADVSIDLPDEVASGKHNWSVKASRAGVVIGQASTRPVSLNRAPQSASADLSDEGRFAMRYRPFLMFDSGEKYRPLTVKALFDEGNTYVNRYRRQGQGVTAARRRAAVDSALFGTTSLEGKTVGYDDELAALSFATRSPFAGCRQGAMLDCNSGSHSGIYFHIVRPRTKADVGARFPALLERRMFWVDWWWFLRDNPVSGGTHRGDWEGVSVAVSSKTGNVGIVAFASHDGVNRYLPGVTRLGGPGQRPFVYVARGTHASYPRPCIKAADPYGESSLDFVGPCAQERTARDKKPDLIAEARSDGKSQWGRNSDSACLLDRNCIIQLGHQTLGVNQVADMARRKTDILAVPKSWNSWRGHWGDTAQGTKSPTAPGQQNRFKRPYWPSEACGIPLSKRKPNSAGYFIAVPPDNDHCDESRAKAASASSVAPATEAGACGEYAGSGVAAVLCDQAQLSEAGIRGEMTLDGTMYITSGRTGDVSDDAPGVAQLLGEPLTPGQSLVFAGTSPETMQAHIQVSANQGLSRVVLDEIGLSEGGSAKFTATADGGGELVRPDGSTVHVAPIATAQQVKVRIASARASGRHLVRVAFTATRGLRALVSVRAKGKTFGQRSIRTTGRSQRVTVKVPSSQRRGLTVVVRIGRVQATRTVLRR